MDIITSLIQGINFPFLRMCDQIIANIPIYGLLLLILLCIGESRNEKRAKVIFALFITFICAVWIKDQTNLQRPCFAQPGCPADGSFPSSHAALAFTLAIAFLNKKSYPAYLLFALFVAFTRINLGVHFFDDVVGALPVALLSYYVTDILFEKVILWIKKPKDRYFTS